MIKQYTLLVACLVATLNFAWAQMSGPIVAGAQGVAMGGTGINIRGVEAAWSNPAGLSDIQGFSAALFAEQRFNLSEIKQTSAVAALPVSQGGLALVLGYYGFDDFNEQRIGIAYGRKLFDNISLGAQLYTLSTRIPEYGNKSSFSFELGMQATISPELSVAARAANPVRIELLDEEYLPSVFSLGLNYEPGKSINLSAELEKDVIEDLRFRFGVAYRLLDALDLRVGVSTAETNLSFGFAYHIKNSWELAVSVAHHQYLGFSPAIGVVYKAKS